MNYETDKLISETEVRHNVKIKVNYYDGEFTSEIKSPTGCLKIKAEILESPEMKAFRETEYSEKAEMQVISQLEKRFIAAIEAFLGK